MQAQPDEVLELDEMWSFVGFRKNKMLEQAVGLAGPVPPHPPDCCLDRCLCRGRPQRGDVRPAVGAGAALVQGRARVHRLLERLPGGDPEGGAPGYGQRRGPDLPYRALQQLTSSASTTHIERFNNTLRQRMARFVRRTLSFSKNDQMHEICLLLFLHDHNRRIQRRFSN